MGWERDWQLSDAKPLKRTLDVRLVRGRKQNVWFSELTVESGPSHYRRSKVGGAGDGEFARLVAEMEESGKPLDSFMV